MGLNKNLSDIPNYVSRTVASGWTIGYNKRPVSMNVVTGSATTLNLNLGDGSVLSTGLSFYDNKFLPLTGGTVSGAILPSISSGLDLGSPTQRWRRIYVDEAMLSTNTLYLGDTPVMGTDGDTINIHADLNQSILIQTAGTGKTNIHSNNGVEVSTSGMNADVIVQASGAGSKVRFGATSTFEVVAPTSIINGFMTVTSGLTISGDLVINGGTTTVNSTTVTTKDNIILLNAGEVGNGVTSGLAGIQVDRGGAADYQIAFDETDDLFKVGLVGDLQAIASREWVSGLNYIKLSSPITGYAVGSNNTLTTTDTILTAFGKIQAQLNAKTSSTGSVTSVGLSVPTGLSVAGSPVTTSGTLAISLQSGYSIPTTAKQTNWDSAYTYSQVGHLPLAGGTLTDILNIEPTGTDPVKLSFTYKGILSKARFSNDGNGLFFATNAYWTGSAWVKDDTTKGSFAMAQHIGNSRFEFRTSGSGSGNVNWITAMVINANGSVGVNSTDTTNKLNVGGVIAASGGTSTDWNTAYSWGNHALAGYLTSFTETDPVFTAHVAYGITSGKISSWDTAYGWGNHASAGYLTSYTETDPIFTAHAAYGITSTLIGNWNTAYTNNHTHSNKAVIDGITAGNVTNWDSAYTYSQLGHVRLSGVINQIIDSGSADTSLSIRTSDNAGMASVNIYGSSQGTGRLYVGQDGSYGGGIEYNGDNNPITTGAGGDYITLFRRDAGVNSWTARNLFNSDNWEFRGNVIATGGNSTQWNSAYTYSQIGHLPLSGGTVTGAVNFSGGDVLFNSINATKYFYFSRNGSKTQEYVRVSLTDAYSFFERKNDEAGGGIEFAVENTDTETGGGVGANTTKVQVYSDASVSQLRMQRNGGAWYRFITDETITNTHRSNWDTAYSWGNHASAGYLKSFTETDPIFTAHAAYGITSPQIGNWDTAYSWGNHASQSYIKLTSTLAGYVAGSNITLATSDTVLAAFGKIQGQLNAKTSNIGTVTSVGMTVPTGLSITGSPITTSGTLAIGLQSGYSIPTTTKQGQWDTAYSRIDSTNIGKTGNVAILGNGTVNSTTYWSNLPVGFAQMMNSSIGTANGAPNSNNGFFLKVGNRDVSGGWSGLWLGTNQDSYIGYSGDGTTYATWIKIWTSANLNNLNQLTTRSFTDLQNIPTTLTGYGITDAVTIGTSQTITGSKTFKNFIDVESTLNTNKLRIHHDGTDAFVNATNGSLKLQQGGSSKIFINTSSVEFLPGVDVNLNTLIRFKGGNSHIREFTATDTSITSLVPGTTQGLLIKGHQNGHVVVALDANDSNDSFNILTHSATVGTENDKVMDRSLLRITRGGEVTFYGSTITAGGNTVWTSGNDGVSSGLDADLLDGQHGSYYMNTTHAATGITTSLITNWNTAYTNNHIHTNKVVLDDIASGDITNWDNAYNNWDSLANVANGYVKLDGNTLIPASLLPSFVDDVVEFANFAAFPATGESGKMYVALDTNKTYRWSGSLYIEISASPGSTDAVPEGSNNLYFTTARARQSISVSGSLSYDNASGVISYTTPAETDPTVPSHVKSITTTNISNWNTAYTNNHSHTNKAVLDGITSGLVTNWDNAYAYTQIKHLPLTGGTLTGDIFGTSATFTQRYLKLGSTGNAGAISFARGNDGAYPVNIGYEVNTSSSDFTFANTGGGGSFAFILNTPSGVQRIAQFFNTGNLILQSGGTYSDAGYRLDVQGTVRFGAKGIRNGDTTISNELNVIHGTGGNTKLTVLSEAVAGNSSIQIGNTGTSGQTWHLLVGGNNVSGQNGSGLNEGNFRISDGTTTRFFITKNTGNIGIGASADNGYRLDVNGTTRLQGDLDVTKSVAYNTIGGTSITLGSYNSDSGDHNRPYKWKINAIGNNTTTGGTRPFTISYVATVGSYSNSVETEALRIGYTGNLLLGTTTDAGYKLDVNGSSMYRGQATFYSSSFGNHIKLNRSSAYGFITMSGSDGIFIGANSTDTVPASTSMLSVRNNGNVIIGTIADAGYKLDVNGSIRGTGLIANGGGIIVGGDDYTGIRFENSTSVGKTLFYQHANYDALVIKDLVNNADRFVFKNNGNLLIGTTTDSGYKLDVNGTSIVRGNSVVEGNISVDSINIGTTAGTRMSQEHIDEITLTTTFTDLVSVSGKRAGWFDYFVYSNTYSSPTVCRTGTVMAAVNGVGQVTFTDTSVDNGGVQDVVFQCVYTSSALRLQGKAVSGNYKVVVFARTM